MRRREFIAGIGAAAWPFVARAQPAERVRRIGVLMPFGENDPPTKVSLTAFVQGLAALGWSEGRNLRIDLRQAGDNFEFAQLYAKELIAQHPDVILVHSTPLTAALQRETRTIPIVFVHVSDPVGSGFVAGLPRPGGNITGFSYHESSMASKWVELLSEVAPGRKLIAALFISIPIPLPMSRHIICPNSRLLPDRSTCSRS
jgi:putative ABC transport system substrate-binding protein